MTVAMAVMLGIALVSAWLAAAAFVRLRTPLERVHVVTFVNVVTIGAITIAAFLADGVTAQTLKILFIWIINLGAGAVLTHATARALHLRGGDTL